ncbi:hypothetical protein LZ30DRAFT_699273 [Colletotrichum cereale]|nr:hypothetical protein LZ30DRAFT_699273 [Colletotrichum cereale]
MVTLKHRDGLMNPVWSAVLASVRRPRIQRGQCVACSYACVFRRRRQKGEGGLRHHTQGRLRRIEQARKCRAKLMQRHKQTPRGLT